ncbi:LytTR family DNA-binding domain-containing protein [Zobellia galactanivorans]|uniref:LytR/AlgR family response regulator transcription factor n=1 Tax=Zobellia TaxID=112040 RepID=UPI000B52A589|nr:MULTISPECIES: LytTR family DNA-binding domain-containing protein [Zobellia]MBU3027054.1 LytTR family DNA-binding domain-containing protein [Zobellia galactanivorans]MDO6808016.1 LytTR family DNA-binding domain-containing protein [Zobellia galactanivorans]OWW24912.1 DNA-binding response regulator [Zobellia sp. OII3]
MDYTYAIIDSDATSNLQLQHYLEDYGDFTCAALAQNSVEGTNVILKYSPDIVFINLNDTASESFHMVMELHQYMNQLPLIIGISKSKEHAYDAIKNGFFDYWILPYNEFDIRKSLLRLKKLMPAKTEPQTLCLKSYRDFQYINTDDILYLQADNNSTEFVMKDGTINNAYKTLKTFENQLPKNFVRIHQSFIVNTNFISRISYGKSYCTLKHNKKQLPFSKSYRENIDILKKLLSKNTISALN